MLWLFDMPRLIVGSSIVIAHHDPARRRNPSPGWAGRRWRRCWPGRPAVPCSAPERCSSCGARTSSSAIIALVMLGGIATIVKAWWEQTSAGSNDSLLVERAESRRSPRRPTGRKRVTPAAPRTPARCVPASGPSVSPGLGACCARECDPCGRWPDTRCSDRAPGSPSCTRRPPAATPTPRRPRVL